MHRDSGTKPLALYWQITNTGSALVVAVALAALFLLASPAIAPAALTLESAGSFPAGASPSSVAIGDLNNDGKPDLAVANADSGSVSVLLGSGAGSFGAVKSFPVGTGPSSVAIGDLNNSGGADLAVTNYDSNNVSVLLGDGTGSFGAASNFATGIGPQSVAIEDFDGNGRLDLAVANLDSNSVSILLGTSSVLFGAKTDYGLGLTSYKAWSVVTGDLNNDGKADVATSNSYYASVLFGSGTGSFGAANYFVRFASSSLRSIAVDDLNDDGGLDLVATDYDGRNAFVWLGNGTGSFDDPGFFRTWTGNFAEERSPVSVAIEDLDRDGSPDLAVANTGSHGDVSILLGDGTGSFGAPSARGAGLHPSSVAIHDLNNDGSPDLAVANRVSGSVSILLNAPTAERFPTSLMFGAPTPVSVGKTSVPQTVTVTNNGSAPLMVSGFSLSGSNPADFATTNNQCGAQVQEGSSCQFDVVFSPIGEGTRSATLTATTNASSDPTVSLAGTAAPAAPTPVKKARISKLKVTGPAKARRGKKATYKVKTSNSGNADAAGVKIRVKGKGASAKKPVGKISAGKSKTVKVKVKFKKPGKVKLTFRATSSNAGSKSVKKKIKVKK